MDPKWLRDLLALHTAQSFSRASQQRNITQSAFSRRIRSLEDWVGTPLVQRESVPLELSAAGKDLIPLARAIIARLDELDAHVAERRNDQRRFLRFAAQHSPSTMALPAHLRALHARIPGLRTHVISANLSDCIDRLNAGRCDIVICYTHPAARLELDGDTYETLRIGTDRLVPVTSTAAAGAWQFPGTQQDPVPVVTYEAESFLGMVLRETLADPGLFAEIRHIDSYSEALKQIVLTGMGVAWLPHALVAEEVRRGALQVLDEEGWCSEMRLAAILRRGAPEPAMRAARAYFAELSAASGG